MPQPLAVTRVRDRASLVLLRSRVASVTIASLSWSCPRRQQTQQVHKLVALDDYEKAFLEAVVAANLVTPE